MFAARLNNIIYNEMKFLVQLFVVVKLFFSLL